MFLGPWKVSFKPDLWPFASCHSPYLTSWCCIWTSLWCSWDHGKFLSNLTFDLLTRVTQLAWPHDAVFEPVCDVLETLESFLYTWPLTFDLSHSPCLTSWCCMSQFVMFLRPEKEKLQSLCLLIGTLRSMSSLKSPPTAIFSMAWPPLSPRHSEWCWSLSRLATCVTTNREKLICMYCIRHIHRAQIFLRFWTEWKNLWELNSRFSDVFITINRRVLKWTCSRGLTREIRENKTTAKITTYTVSVANFMFFPTCQEVLNYTGLLLFHETVRNVR